MLGDKNIGALRRKLWQELAHRVTGHEMFQCWDLFKEEAAIHAGGVVFHFGEDDRNAKFMRAVAQDDILLQGRDGTRPCIKR